MSPETYDNLPFQNKINLLKGISTTPDGVLDEDLMRFNLNKWVKAGKIPKGFGPLIDKALIGESNEGAISSPILEKIGEVLTIDMSKKNPKKVATSLGLDDDEYDERIEQVRKVMSKVTKNYEGLQEDDEERMAFEHALKLVVVKNPDGITAEDMHEEIFDAQDYFIPDPSNSSFSIPVNRQKVNRYTNANGDTVFMDYTDDDLKLMVQSVYERHYRNVVEKWEEALSKDPSERTEEEKQIVGMSKANLVKTGDIIEGGTNYDAKIVPDPKGTGLTFKIYGLNGNSFDVNGIHASSINSSMVVNWKQQQEILRNIYIHSISGDLLEFFSPQMLVGFEGKPKTLKTMRKLKEDFEKNGIVKDQDGKITFSKSKRGGRDHWLLGEGSPTSITNNLLGFMQSFFLDWRANWERLGVPEAYTQYIPQFAGDDQVHSRGIEFMGLYNWFDSLSKAPRIGKLEYDWISETLGKMPADINEEDAFKQIQKIHKNSETDLNKIHEEIAYHFNNMGSYLQQIGSVVSGAMKIIAERDLGIKYGGPKGRKPYDVDQILN